MERLADNSIRELYNMVVPMIYDGRLHILDFMAVFPHLRRRKLITEFNHVDAKMKIFYLFYLGVFKDRIMLDLDTVETPPMDFYDYLVQHGFDNKKYLPALRRLALAGL